MRKYMEQVRQNSRKIYIPYSFESMMLSFGQNLERDTCQKNIDIKIKKLNKKIKSKHSTLNDLDSIIKEEVDAFVSMIKANDVEEQDFKNKDNELYMKLISKSKTRLD